MGEEIEARTIPDDFRSWVSLVKMERSVVPSWLEF